jgi:hypothetical protein
VLIYGNNHNVSGSLDANVDRAYARAASKSTPRRQAGETQRGSRADDELWSLLTGGVNVSRPRQWLAELAQVREAFDSHDRSGRGRVDSSMLVSVLRKLRWSTPTLATDVHAWLRRYNVVGETLTLEQVAKAHYDVVGPPRWDEGAKPVPRPNFDDDDEEESQDDVSDQEEEDGGAMESKSDSRTRRRGRSGASWSEDEYENESNDGMYESDF